MVKGALKSFVDKSYRGVLWVLELLHAREIYWFMDSISQLPEVGVTWFREEDYPALLHIFEDADKMPRSWKEWLKRAEQMEKRAKAQGYSTARIYIDPDDFRDWCLREGMRIGSEARRKFVVDTVAAKYICKS
jgi:hypothetical protein